MMEGRATDAQSMGFLKGSVINGRMLRLP